MVGNCLMPCVFFQIHFPVLHGGNNVHAHDQLDSYTLRGELSLIILKFPALSLIYSFIQCFFGGYH